MVPAVLVGRAWKAWADPLVPIPSVVALVRELADPAVHPEASAEDLEAADPAAVAPADLAAAVRAVAVEPRQAVAADKLVGVRANRREAATRAASRGRRPPKACGA